jgi:hypothetical protein
MAEDKVTRPPGLSAERCRIPAVLTSGRSKVERNLAKQGFNKKFIQEAEAQLIRHLEN